MHSTAHDAVLTSSDFHFIDTVCKRFQGSVRKNGRRECERDRRAPAKHAPVLHADPRPPGPIGQLLVRVRVLRHEAATRLL